ncbi:MAG: flagellar hook-associated protein FlgK [Gemmatimonadota bacterium]
MPSAFGSILSIARTAIAAHQAAMETISHNIANAETPGYSRQRAELTARRPQRIPFAGNVGTGVDVSNIVRVRNAHLDGVYRREAGDAAAYSTRSALMHELEQVLNEPSDTGLAATLDEFWNAWSDLSNTPNDPTAQSVVRQRGQQVAQLFNTYASRLAETSNRARGQFGGVVQDVNRIAGQIAQINGAITAAEADGRQAGDLRDERDRLADQLAQLAGARADMQSNGTIAVYIGGIAVVSGSATQTIEVRGGVTPTLGIVGDPDPLYGASGSLGALMAYVNVDVPSVMTRLDALARGVVNGVNELHTSGWTAAGDALGVANWNSAMGPTGSRIEFFDPAMTTAANIRLSSAVSADARVVAAGDVQNAPGNNAVAMALAALRDANGMNALATRMGAAFAAQIGFAPGEAYADHYRSTVSIVGLEASEAARQETIFTTLSEQADTRRMSVSGVSIDEELTDLMRTQQAYVAATKLVNTVDDMAQAILDMV